MMVLRAGKIFPFFVILHQVLLKSNQVTGASANISWFSEYDKCKFIIITRYVVFQYSFGANY
jgi:hypothetical protein